MIERKQSFIFFIFIFIVVLAAAFKIVFPFIAAFVFAGILAGTFSGLNHKISNALKISLEYSSIITCILILILVIAPTVYLIYQISQETIHLYELVKNTLSEGEVKNFIFGNSAFAKFFQATLAKFNIELTYEVLREKILVFSQGIIGAIAKNVNGLISNFIVLIIDFGIMMIAIYGILANGEQLKKYYFNLSPLNDDDDELILRKFNQMNYVSLFTNGIGGIIQGVAAGIAFGLAGFNSVFFWATLMTVMAFIPMLGISPIVIPACIYLWIKGHVVASILVAVFCLGIAFCVENIFKPKFIGSRLQVNSMVMMLFIFGGITNFGIAGIFYGPIICILLFTFIDLYKLKYKNYEI